MEDEITCTVWPTEDMSSDFTGEGLHHDDGEEDDGIFQFLCHGYVHIVLADLPTDFEAD